MSAAASSRVSSTRAASATQRERPDLRGGLPASWHDRIETVNGPPPMGHEYVGIVEEVGREFAATKPGEFVVGSFFASDNTCEKAGRLSELVPPPRTHRPPRRPAEYLRVPLADGTLVATSDGFSPPGAHWSSPIMTPRIE
jgi:threonine dehydrogenase-like Zn-dependent dehydrogenase